MDTLATFLMTDGIYEKTIVESSTFSSYHHHEIHLSHLYRHRHHGGHCFVFSPHTRAGVYFVNSIVWFLRMHAWCFLFGLSYRFTPFASCPGRGLVGLRERGQVMANSKSTSKSQSMNPPTYLPSHARHA